MTDFENQMQKRLFVSLPRIGVLVMGLLLMATTALFAQNLTVSGTVSDAQTGEVLPGVNVIQKGTTNGAVTNFDGEYQISVPADATIQFSFIGYLPVEMEVNGRTSLSLELETDTKQLDEVIAVGYGSIKKRDNTGSISTISGEELQKIPVASAADAIKGRLPGVNITTTDGSPDAEIVIRVRGGGSVTQDNSPLYVVDGFIVESIRDIPPSDITSINVLKDAASTAIYGAQAANGVIIITTRGAEAGKTKVSYNGYLQYKQLPRERKLEVLDPYEYVMAQYEYAKMRSDADLRNFEKFYGKYDDLELYNYKKPTDWQQELFGSNQLSQSHNVSISGGTQATKLSLSYTNNKDEGIMIGNGYVRNAINFKLNHKIFEKLTFDASARITDTQVDGAGTSGSAQLRVRDVITSRPVNGIADELDIDLNEIDSSDDYQSFLLSMINPLELAEQDWRRKNTNNYVINAGLTWNPIQNLILKTTFTDSRTYEERFRYYGPLTSQSRQEGNSLPLGTKEGKNDFSYRWLNTANYIFEDLGAHELSILAGHEIYSSGGHGYSVRSENFRESMQPEELFANMALGTTDAHSTYVSTNNNRVSYFGRVNYQYNQKYLAAITLRTDMSSKFSEANRVGIFPAIALGWKMSEEPFIRNLDVFDELKLRISYGETGNDRIPSNATKFLFRASTNNGPGMGTNGYNAYYSPDGSTLFNPDIRWETTVNRNLGLDFMVFNGRISGNLDLYQNTTRDLLLASAISPISGFNTQWNNIGSTSNKGIELALNAFIVERGDFTFSGNLNFGINRANIDALDGTDERFYQSNWASTDLKDRDDFYLKVGETVGLIYGYRNDGMYTVDDFESYDETSGTYVLKEGVPNNSQTLGVNDVKPGFMKIKDLNNDSLINSLDREVIGSALPLATGGFGFNMTYKGFDMSALFNWSYGNDIYNTGKIEFNQLYRTTFGNMLSSQSSDERFTYIDVDGSYTGTAGEVVTDLEQLRQMNQGKAMWNGPNSFGQATAVITDWAVEDGSFLRLNTLTLGYTVPANVSNRIGMSQLRLYVSGNNIWVWTKYSGFDPEVSTTRSSSYSALTPGVDYSAYPRSRSFTFGVNVTF
ncbi:SusC/RagA family TonB-linked outer membrane protein [Roseimarinus sediminis]|uniref:SusC/RagA family TonB-linked outer membrane protein n=1 Tax=Roseimarinus sediminis TaxID=1610899 RepID=UPI003D1E2745